MAKLKLVQATDIDGVWTRLRSSWEKQLEDHGAFTEWELPHLNHAQTIVSEGGKDQRYGIFVACADRHGSSVAPYDGFVHVNYKLMKTSAAEIRMVWNRLAPRFQFKDLRNEVAEVQTTFLTGILRHSAELERRPSVKMFLGNPIDIAFGRQFALIVNNMSGMNLKANVRGNWLHLVWADKPPARRDR